MKRRLTITIATIILFFSCKDFTSESKKNSVKIDLDSAISHFAIKNIKISKSTQYDENGVTLTTDVVVFPQENEDEDSFSQVRQIYYENELLNSKVTRIYPNGKLKFEAECINGWIEGTTKTYDSLGNLTYKDNFKEGKLNGICETYHPNKKLARSIPMSNGKVNGTKKSYFENGNLAFEGDFINDEKAGTQVYYYISGSKSAVLPYSYGIRPHSVYRDTTEMGYRAHGNFFEFFENGDIKYKAKYVNGRPDGEVVAFYEKNKLMYIQNWKNGKIVGEA